MTTKLGRVLTLVRELNIQSRVTFRLNGHVTNLENLYLHFHNMYDHQSWQSGNLWLNDSIH